MKLPSITVGGTARDIAQDVQNSSNVLGDVGISVIVEVGSGAGFLRVSDVAPDSSAEA